LAGGVLTFQARCAMVVVDAGHSMDLGAVADALVMACRQSAHLGIPSVGSRRMAEPEQRLTAEPGNGGPVPKFRSIEFAGNPRGR
jgi:hypothetical protein